LINYFSQNGKKNKKRKSSENQIYTLTKPYMSNLKLEFNFQIGHYW